jgi:hypothetical protein
MDTLKKVIRGQQAKMKNGEIITLTEKGKIESSVRAINSRDKIVCVNIHDIEELLPIPEMHTPRKDLCDQIDMPFYKGIRPTEKERRRRAG